MAIARTLFLEHENERVEGERWGYVPHYPVNKICMAEPVQALPPPKSKSILQETFYVTLEHIHHKTGEWQKDSSLNRKVIVIVDCTEDMTVAPACHSFGGSRVS